MIIIKIGGGEKINLESIISELYHIKSKMIIVHGANAFRDKLAGSLGIVKEVLVSLKGYSSVRSTDEIIDLMKMSYSGYMNKSIVEMCIQNDINAVGLSGVDGSLVKGIRNKGIRTIINGKKKIVRDRSGKPKSINVDLLNLLLENNYTPVLTMPILDENNISINSENDDVVRLLANYFLPEKIIFLIEAPGYLQDPNDDNSIIESMNLEQLELLIENSEGRIQRKLKSISEMLQDGKSEIIMADGRRENPISNLLNRNGKYTRFTQ